MRLYFKSPCWLMKNRRDEPRVGTQHALLPQVTKPLGGESRKNEKNARVTRGVRARPRLDLQGDTGKTDFKKETRSLPPKEQNGNSREEGGGPSRSGGKGRTRTATIRGSAMPNTHRTRTNTLATAGRRLRKTKGTLLRMV